MTRLTGFFLILLRLAIGWHFLVEGYQKIESQYLIGETVYNKPFSSAGYFREAPGPLGQLVRSYAGDPDREILARLTVRQIPEGQDSATYPPQKRVPPALHRDWIRYLQEFTAHYDLSQSQSTRAAAILEQAESKVVQWLTYQPSADPQRDPNYTEYTSEQSRTYPSGEIKVRMNMSQRLEEYRRRLDELQAADDRNYRFGRDVEKARWRQAKADVASWRAGLQADLDKHTQAYKTALEGILTPEQKALAPFQPTKEANLIDYLDLVTPWALAVMGGCLILGLFSRLAALAAAFFLLMTYLAVPSYPWLPTPPASEGNYFFVNKNVIEMLALLVLAVTPTGRWFGLDAIPYAIGVWLFGPKEESAQS